MNGGHDVGAVVAVLARPFRLLLAIGVSLVLTVGCSSNSDQATAPPSQERTASAAESQPPGLDISTPEDTSSLPEQPADKPDTSRQVSEGYCQSLPVESLDPLADFDLQPGSVQGADSAVACYWHSPQQGLFQVAVNLGLYDFYFNEPTPIPEIQSSPGTFDCIEPHQNSGSFWRHSCDLQVDTGGWGLLSVQVEETFDGDTSQPQLDVKAAALSVARRALTELAASPGQ